MRIVLSIEGGGDAFIPTLKEAAIYIGITKSTT